MAGEYLDRVQESLDAFDRRDKAAWVEMVDPDIQAIPTDDWPENEIRGADAVWEFLLATDDPWEPSPYELTEVTEGDDYVVARMRREMRGKTSGVEVDYDYWFRADFAGARATLLRWFGTREQALDASKG